MQTNNLKELRELRAQEKAIKASIETIKPLAIEEAKALAPEGGKFPVEGVGEFILDKDPILPIDKSRCAEAKEYRRQEKERDFHRKEASSFTKTMKGLYDTLKIKLAGKVEEYTYTLKCVGLD